ncbi:hypothetical protein T08_11191 [Trichinella sp. T8]|nr:hypothetical protein T08_11191 [Trichinella sp. T8]
MFNSIALNSATQPYAFDSLARFSWRLHSHLNINPNGIIQLNIRTYIAQGELLSRKNKQIICISLIYFYLKNTITSHDYTTSAIHTENCAEIVLADVIEILGAYCCLMECKH